MVSVVPENDGGGARSGCWRRTRFKRVCAARPPWALAAATPAPKIDRPRRRRGSRAASVVPLFEDDWRRVAGSGRERGKASLEFSRERGRCRWRRPRNSWCPRSRRPQPRAHRVIGRCTAVAGVRCRRRSPLWIWPTAGSVVAGSGQRRRRRRRCSWERRRRLRTLRAAERRRGRHLGRRGGDDSSLMRRWRHRSARGAEPARALARRGRWRGCPPPPPPPPLLGRGRSGRRAG